jgi:hypothetical protein
LRTRGWGRGQSEQLSRRVAGAGGQDGRRGGAGSRHARPRRRVKFETTPAFDSDYRRLAPEHAASFRQVVRDKFAPACDAFADDPSRPGPASLRVKSVRGAPGVLEMTWSFASPGAEVSARKLSTRFTAVSGHRSHLSLGVGDEDAATDRDCGADRGPQQERGRPRVRGVPPVGDQSRAALPRRGRGRARAAFASAADQPVPHGGGSRGRDRRDTQGARPGRARGARRRSVSAARNPACPSAAVTTR